MCCCSARCARILIVISSILMILIGIAIIIIACIPQTTDMISFLSKYGQWIKIIGIIIGSICIGLGVFGIISTIPTGYCKICFSVFYIIGMKIIFLIFVIIFILSLILQGVVINSGTLTSYICSWISNTEIENAFQTIKSHKSMSCPNNCAARTNIFTCSGQQTALLGNTDVSNYRTFFEYLGKVEETNSCSGLCPNDIMNCFYFSDITKATSTNTKACIESVYTNFKQYALGISIASGIIFCIAFINFCSGYIVCCSKDEE